LTTTINASTSSGLVNTADTSGILQLQTANTAALTITAAQNVGIGTASPSALLHIYGNANTSNVFLSNAATLAAGGGGLTLSIDNSLNATLTNAKAGYVSFGTSNVEQMRIDSSGNVGIGTTSPVASTKLTINGSNDQIYLRTADTNAVVMSIGNAAGNSVYFQSKATGTGTALPFAWYMGGTQSMTLDASGNLLVGRTTTAAGLGGDTPIVFANGAFCSYVGAYNAQYSSDRINFNNANYYVVNGSTVGVKLVSGSTSWTTQSDERTKTDLVPIANGLQKVNTLRAVTGRYTKDEEGVSRAFLIAQDVKAVLPEAVDEDTDEEKTLGLRYTETIPLLVAAIQELKTINDTQAETINALTARIVALEGK
jgi:hypothetical protein